MAQAGTYHAEESVLKLSNCGRHRAHEILIKISDCYEIYLR